jgi:hypothetical protein
MLCGGRVEPLERYPAVIPLLTVLLTENAGDSPRKWPFHAVTCRLVVFLLRFRVC